MRLKVISRISVFIMGCFLLIPFTTFAKNRQDWDKEMMAIYTNDQLTDSLKIIQMADLTFDYSLYYRIMNEEIMNSYLNLMLPLIQRNNSDNLKIYLYKPIFFVSAAPEDELVFRENYIKFIENSTDLMAKFQGWMIIGQATIDESVSLNYLFQALEVVKGPKYRKEQAEAYQHISYHYSQKNHANQLKYALQSVELAKESGDVWQMIGSWKELGTAYYEDPENKYVDEALNAYNNSRNLFTDKFKIQQYDIHSPEYFHYMEILVTIGSIYQAKNQMGEAVKTLEEALHIATANNMVETQAFCHKELGVLYQNLREYQKAERNYLTAERLMAANTRETVEGNHIDYEIKLQLAELYRITRHYKSSVSYFEAGIQKYRQMFDEEIMAENQRIRAYYEAQKQERDITGLKAIVELKEKQKYYYWALAIILTLILFFLYRLYSYKITTVRQHEQQLRNEATLLELDRSNAELQARLKQEETEQLQQKLTVGDDLLEHKNKILEDLQQFFAGNSELNEYRDLIKNILTQQNRVESNMGDIKTGLQDVPLDFYVHLQKQADNKLTPLDLKYCRLIYLKTPSKVMGELLFVDLKTIRVNKYRLKQKLKLGKEDDLQTFIENIIPGKEGER